MIGKMNTLEDHKKIIKDLFNNYFNEFKNEIIDIKIDDDIYELICKYQSKLTDYVYKNYPSGHGIIPGIDIKFTHPLDELHINVLYYAYELNEKYLEFTQNENKNHP